MSHVEPSADVPAAPTPPPAPEPPAHPAAPATPPASPAPPQEGHGGGDRIGNLETIVGNLSDAFTAFTEAISNGNPAEDKPQKLPWTHWGSKHRDA